jgi:hypothetical protein
MKIESKLYVMNMTLFKTDKCMMFEGLITTLVINVTIAYLLVQHANIIPDGVIMIILIKLVFTMSLTCNVISRSMRYQHFMNQMEYLRDDINIITTFYSRDPIVHNLRLVNIFNENTIPRYHVMIEITYELIGLNMLLNEAGRNYKMELRKGEKYLYTNNIENAGDANRPLRLPKNIDILIFKSGFDIRFILFIIIIELCPIIFLLYRRIPKDKFTLSFEVIN